MRSPHDRSRPSPWAAALLAFALAPLACGRAGPDPAAARKAPGLDPGVPISTTPIEALDDVRLRPLREASARWRAARGPTRAVVDQVVLAADLPSFFEAVASWDDRNFFPVLLDDPAWTLPFLRAFRPARIVRIRSDGIADRGGLAGWRAAQEAVSRSWAPTRREAQEDVPPPGSAPRGLGPTPPGVVFSHPDSPSLAGAVALAAGRFQPLARLEPIATEATPDEPARRLGFADVADVGQAFAFAHRVESRIAADFRSYDDLGDEADFLTFAGDWPYRYRHEGGEGLMRGDRAIDDLVGRTLPDDPAEIDSARTRWAYAGRLLGDPAASASRAISSLFLQPETALFWNTYGGGAPWADYDVNGAATVWRVIRPGSEASDARSGVAADLSSWRESFRSDGRWQFLSLNSSGSPEEFSIAGGPGHPADVPLRAPGLVSMTHSFSAARPLDPDTIAGRFLERGVFAYFGSMNEPYLTAFRTPYLLSQLIAAETPLAAAFRQGPYEAFGHPWRLVYLGDPLYTISPTGAAFGPERTVPDDGFESLSHLQGVEARTLGDGPRPPATDSAAILDWCLEAVLLAQRRDAPPAPPDLLSVLTEIDRDLLDPGRRLVLDILLIDGYVAAGDEAGLLEVLLRLRPRDRSPRVWGAIETAAAGRLAALGRDDFGAVLDLWSRLVVAPWPVDSDYPSQLTRSVAASAQADGPARIDPFRRRLAEARDLLAERNLFPDRRRMLAETLDRMSNEAKVD